MEVKKQIHKHSRISSYTGWMMALDNLFLLTYELCNKNKDQRDDPIPITFESRVLIQNKEKDAELYQCDIKDIFFIDKESERVFSFDDYGSILRVDYKALICFDNFNICIRYHITKEPNNCAARVYKQYSIIDDHGERFMHDGYILPIDMQEQLYDYHHLQYIIDFCKTNQLNIHFIAPMYNNTKFNSLTFEISDQTRSIIFMISEITDDYDAKPGTVIFPGEQSYSRNGLTGYNATKHIRKFFDAKNPF